MKSKILITLALVTIIVFQTCKPKENLTRKEGTQTNNKGLVGNDTVPGKDKNAIAIGNDKDSTKTNTVKKNAENDGIKDTIVPILTIPETEYDPDPPREYPITVPMPKIVTDLFPDYEWKLFVNNKGHNKYYVTKVGNSSYAYSRINDLVSSKYKKGDISDKKLIELFIFLFLHSYYNEMKITTTEYLEKKYYVCNYKSIVETNNGKIEFYSFVEKNEYIGYIAIKDNRLFKEGYIK